MELLAAIADALSGTFTLVGRGFRGLLGQRASGAESLNAAADVVAGVIVVLVAVGVLVAVALTILS